MTRAISIITPWHGETGPALAGDYYRTVEGSAQVITVDNACPSATASILSEMTSQLAGEYIRNETNAGFAAANNQGYARATGDIVIFLNSDVAPAGPWLAQVAKDVRDGALYGPSLQSQLVAGRHLPYLEGWCVAATRQTWERLSKHSHKETLTALDRGPIPDCALGPWDALNYPGPYWEDNDLCLRALSLDIALIQTSWPVHHKGGQTAGPIMKHGESFAKNEWTFTQRALKALQAPAMTDIWARYMQAYHTPSDINHHLGLLYSLARGNVVELGTRTGVSTAALLAGVAERGGHVWSVDLEDCSGLFDSELWTFVQGDSRDVDGFFSRITVPPELRDVTGRMLFDLILIDTEHTYEQAAAELDAWSEYLWPGGHILLHDTETFPGVRRAVEEFCQEKGWEVTYILPCNGMAIVEVPG